MFDFAKKPRPSLCRSTDHQRIRTRRFEYQARFLGRVDVTIGDDRDPCHRFDGANGVVFGATGITAGARPTMQSQRLNADLFGDVQDVQRIAVRGIPAGTDFQGYRCRRYRLHDRIENPSDQ